MGDGFSFKLKWSVITRFYPASIIVDSELNVAQFGPSIERQLPEIRIGVNISDVFVREDASASISLIDVADSGTLIDLVSNNRSIRIRGPVASGDGAYLILGRYLPSPLMLGSDLKMSDFAPSDPIVQAMLMVGVQKAMLQEAEEAARELVRARQKSAEILQRFSRLAGFMAHDFNNLLSIIRLNTERLLGDDNLSFRNKHLSMIIQETTNRGSEISRSLMTLSSQRYDSFLPLNIDELIADNAAFLRSVAGARIALTVSLNARGAHLLTSREGILNSLVNLIINARDVMPDGGDVHISTSRRNGVKPGDEIEDAQECADFVILEVRDTGPGMPDDVAERAFEPLFSTKKNGTGIGLASVLDFAREMGGDAKVNSHSSQGTCIAIQLPVHSLVEPQIYSNSAEPNPKADLGATDFEGRSVLIVEDEVYALEALTEMLEFWGLSVRACGGVSEARSVLEQPDRPNFDLLLSDIVMKDGSGIDLAEFSCVLIPEIRVILMSGFIPATETMRPDWQFLRKPLNSLVLQEILIAAFAKN
ncbi:ATP-binding protein [Novosphingobium sp. MW5]|nr:ATP-binding protein [Novosphingobium sp. MW5]